MQTTARAPKYRKSKSSLCALFVIILIFVVIVYTIGRMTEHPFLHIHAEKASKMKNNKYGSANSNELNVIERFFCFVHVSSLLQQMC
jgi:hypothetical protein